MYKYILHTYIPITYKHISNLKTKCVYNNFRIFSTILFVRIGISKLCLP